MAIELTNLLQHANTVASSGHENQAIYIKQDGTISKDSGLAHIKRPSADQKKAENQATLEAFKQALIEENPLYESLLTGEGADYDLAKFFTTKHEQGSPLTAKDVRTVKGLMDMAYATSIGKMLAGADMLRGMDATSFAWYCVGKGLNLDSTESKRAALKQFYTDNYCSETMTNALRAAGVPEDALGPAKAMLLKSATFKEAMDKAFADDLTSVTWETIVADLGKELGPACKNMVDLIQGNPGAAKSLFSSLANLRGSEGVALFDGFMKIVQGGGLSESEKVDFFHQCRDEHTDLTTPEAQSSALRRYLVDQRSDKIMEDFAVSNDLPKQLGTNLSHLPPLKALIQKELSAIVPPPAVPTQAQIEQAIDRAGSIFLADKGEAIQKIMALGKLTVADIEANPMLAHLTTKPLEGGQLVSQERLLEMINSMLYSDALLDKLLAPEAGADIDLIRTLQDFQDGTESCQHTVPGTYGGPELMDLSMDSLLLMMVARGATAEDMEKLLLNVDKNLRPISLGIESLRNGAMTGKINAPDRFGIANSLPYLQNAMRKITQFAYDMVSDDRKTALGIETNATKFFGGMEEIDRKPQPLDDMHQSVRDYAIGLGVNMMRVGYKENTPLSVSVTSAFTGSPDDPALTPLFIEKATAIAAELGLTGLDVANLDPVTIGSLMQRAISDSKNERLTEAQAQKIAEDIIRKTLDDYKPTLDFINGLPTAPVPGDSKAFIISPEEKALLLRIIPGSLLRDPELIKAVILESRAMSPYFSTLLVPGMNATDMARSLMEISSTHVTKIGALALPQTSEGQRHGALPVALQLLMGGRNLTQDQSRMLYDLVSGKEGKLLGGSAVGMASTCMIHKKDVTNAEVKIAGLMTTVTVMDNMRLILGKQLGLDHEVDPLYYGEIEPQNIPAGIITDMEKAFKLNSKDLPGYEALSLHTPPLSQEQWDTLLPMMSMIAKGVKNSFDCGIILRMVSANAPELLAARASKGKDLTPADIWKVVIGGKPPKGLTAENLGDTMHQHAIATLIKLGARTSDIPPDSMVPVVAFNLGQGVTFKTIIDNMKPGGKLTLDDIRFKSNVGLSSLSRYHEDNAYGLTTDFRRRRTDPMTNAPSQISITSNAGDPKLYLHLPVSESDNKPGYYQYQNIMARCREITSTELQFMRVMQCLSQASTVNMRMLAEMFPGQGFDEHGHAYVKVNEQPNGDVLVEITSGENVKPIGGHMKILVDPHGNFTLQDLTVEFK